MERINFSFIIKDYLSPQLNKIIETTKINFSEIADFSISNYLNKNICGNYFEILLIIYRIEDGVDRYYQGLGKDVGRLQEIIDNSIGIGNFLVSMLESKNNMLLNFFNKINGFNENSRTNIQEYVFALDDAIKLQDNEWLKYYQKIINILIKYFNNKEEKLEFFIGKPLYYSIYKQISELNEILNKIKYEQNNFEQLSKDFYEYIKKSPFKLIPIN